MRSRVQVELAWLAALSDLGLPEFKPFSAAARTRLNQIVTEFSPADAARIKHIEAVTNHDVKAVEYFLKEKIKGNAELEAATEFIHFACTSEDINNTSHGLMLAGARRDVLVPMLRAVHAKLVGLAHEHAALPMLSRTHGQTASPTRSEEHTSELQSH